MPFLFEAAFGAFLTMLCIVNMECKMQNLEVPAKYRYGVSLLLVVFVVMIDVIIRQLAR